ncbi:MAG: biotin/lipoyl-containing protein [Pseudomonadota bacterium]
MSRAAAADDGDPWTALSGVRLNAPAKTVFWLDWSDGPALVRLTADAAEANAYVATLERRAGAAARRAGEAFDASPMTVRFRIDHVDEAGDVRLTVDGRPTFASLAAHVGGLRIWFGADHVDVVYADPLSAVGAGAAQEGGLVAPMPGVVTLLKAAIGDRVEAGDTLLVMEAMKMEHAVKAPHAGVVESFRFGPGDAVREGEELVALSGDETAS